MSVTIQSPANLPLLQYNTSLAIQFLPQAAIQSFSFQAAIQSLLTIQYLQPLQYSWAVAQPTFSAPKFFFSSFLPCSSHWKFFFLKKIHVCKIFFFFIFHFPHSNKFIKVYYSSFSSILQLVNLIKLFSSILIQYIYKNLFLIFSSTYKIIFIT